MSSGILFALGCYGLWGVLPIFWKLLNHISALDILAHRIIWSFVFTWLFLCWRRDFSWYRIYFQDFNVLWRSLLMACFISINWSLYIWAVNSNYVVEASLGYFMNPLFSTLLGIIFLKERFRKLQALAFLFAIIGVIILWYAYGRMPWIALILASSFAFYGLLKKQLPIGVIQGLTFESAILSLPAMFYLAFILDPSHTFFEAHSPLDNILLVLAGPLTGIPMIFFALAAQRLTLMSLGIFQYLAPSLQFLIGIFLFREPFSLDDLLGFSFIWTAIAIFLFDAVYFRRKKQRIYL